MMGMGSVEGSVWDRRADGRRSRLISSWSAAVRRHVGVVAGHVGHLRVHHAGCRIVDAKSCHSLIEGVHVGHASLRVLLRMALDHVGGDALSVRLEHHGSDVAGLRSHSWSRIAIHILVEHEVRLAEHPLIY